MPPSVRKLAPEEVVIGFISPNGELIGELVDFSIGHEAHSYTVFGLRSKLATGHAIGITIGKSRTGDIKVIGSAAFLPPGGRVLSDALCDLAKRLVE